MAELNVKLCILIRRVAVEGGQFLCGTRRSMGRATTAAKKGVATTAASTHFPSKAMPNDRSDFFALNILQ